MYTVVIKLYYNKVILFTYCQDNISHQPQHWWKLNKLMVRIVRIEIDHRHEGKGLFFSIKTWRTVTCNNEKVGTVF
jgi:hypothetical protein